MQYFEFSTVGGEGFEFIVFAFSENEMEWLKEKERRMDKLRTEVKNQRKKMFKQKILQLV